MCTAAVLNTDKNPLKTSIEAYNYVGLSDKILYHGMKTVVGNKRFLQGGYMFYILQVVLQYYSSQSRVLNSFKAM